MTTYVPLADNVIVKKVEAATTTASGIVLAGRGVDHAKVVAAGPLAQAVKVDDICIVAWNEATLIEDNLYRLAVRSIVALVQ